MLELQQKWPLKNREVLADVIIVYERWQGAGYLHISLASPMSLSSCS
jgi:hypothetical protein